MPLIKPVLELQILAAFRKLSSSKLPLEQSQQELARDLSTAIDQYIKSQTIIVPAGQAVATVSPVSGPAPGTTVSPIVATIS